MQIVTRSMTTPRPLSQPDGFSEPSAPDVLAKAIDAATEALIRAIAIQRAQTLPTAALQTLPGWPTFRLAVLKAMAWCDASAKARALHDAILDLCEEDDVDELESKEAALVRRAILTYEAHLTQQAERVSR